MPFTILNESGSRLMSFFRYEMRRECQEILPGLLLGPFVASKSQETLTSLGVTHMYVLILFSMARIRSTGSALFDLAYVYEMSRKRSLLNLVFPIGTNTSYWMLKITRSRI